MTNEKKSKLWKKQWFFQRLLHLLGALMLANGAEIYRVEDTVERIIRSKEAIKDVDVFSSYNMIMISFSYKGEIHTNMRRVRNRGNNLYYVDRVNTFSRNFSAGLYSLDEALMEIDKIKKRKICTYLLKKLGSYASCGFLLNTSWWKYYRSN